MRCTYYDEAVPLSTAVTLILPFLTSPPGHAGTIKAEGLVDVLQVSISTPRPTHLRPNDPTKASDQMCRALTFWVSIFPHEPGFCIHFHLTQGNPNPEPPRSFFAAKRCRVVLWAQQAREREMKSTATTRGTTRDMCWFGKGENQFWFGYLAGLLLCTSPIPVPDPRPKKSIGRQNSLNRGPETRAASTPNKCTAGQRTAPDIVGVVTWEAVVGRAANTSSEYTPRTGRQQEGYNSARGRDWTAI